MCNLTPVAKHHPNSLAEVIIHPDTGADISDSAWPQYAHLIGQTLTGVSSYVVDNRYGGPNPVDYTLNYCAFRAYINDFGVPKLKIVEGSKLSSSRPFALLIDQIAKNQINDPNLTEHDGEYLDSNYLNGGGHTTCAATLNNRGIDINKESIVSRYAWGSGLDSGFTTSFDITPPLASITSPTNNAVVSGVVPIMVTASDNIQMDGVLAKSSKTGLIAPKTSTQPYLINWDTRREPDGPKTITVNASDFSSNVGQATIDVITNNHKAEISFPTHNAKITSNTNILFSVDDSVNNGGSIALYIDGVKKYQTNVSPRTFSYNWPLASIGFGNHEIKIILTEAVIVNGNLLTSEMSINVTR